MTTAQEMIRKALNDAEHADVNIQPAIIMNLNIDHSQVAEYTSCHLNDAWAATIKEHIDAGWVAFRIQTEFGINGHSTKIYLAKMKG